MGLLQKLKSTLGLGGSRSRRGPDRTGEVDVRVEHEPAAETEAAVKGTDAEPVKSAEVAHAEAASEEESAPDESTPSDEGTGEETDESTPSDEETTGKEAGSGADVPVDELSGIGPAYAERLGDAGVESVADLADADVEDVAESSGISQGRIESWIEQAGEY